MESLLGSSNDVIRALYKEVILIHLESNST